MSRATTATYASTFFTDLAKIETSSYWKAILMKCSIGKLPRKCNLRKDGKIMYLTNTRGVSGQILLQGAPEDMLEVIKNAFKKHCKMSSPEDNASNIECLTNSKTTAEAIDWDSWNNLVKNKCILSLIISNHVLLLAEKFNLNISEQGEVYRVLIVAISLGQVTSEDVKFRKGILVRVKNFEWNNEIRKGTINYTVDKKTSVNKVNKKEAMSKQWDLYLKTNKKKRGS